MAVSTITFDRSKEEYAPRDLDDNFWYVFDGSDKKSVENPWEMLTDAALFNLCYIKALRYNEYADIREAPKATLVFPNFINIWRMSGYPMNPEFGEKFMFFGTERKVIFVPMLCLPQGRLTGHYFLVQIQKIRGKGYINVYDSLAILNGFYVNELELRKMAELFMDMPHDEWNLRHARCAPDADDNHITPQNDFVSCGVHTILNLESLLKRTGRKKALKLRYARDETVLETRQRLLGELDRIHQYQENQVGLNEIEVWEEINSDESTNDRTDMPAAAADFSVNTTVVKHLVESLEEFVIRKDEESDFSFVSLVEKLDAEKNKEVKEADTQIMKRRKKRQRYLHELSKNGSRLCTTPQKQQTPMKQSKSGKEINFNDVAVPGPSKENSPCKIAAIRKETMISKSFSVKKQWHKNSDSSDEEGMSSAYHMESHKRIISELSELDCLD